MIPLFFFSVKESAPVFEHLPLPEVEPLDAFVDFILTPLPALNSTELP